VRSSAYQVEQLMAWAAPFTQRTWAIEGAGGLGYLLAQQLVAAGERVVDVQPKLAARVRLLATGASNKNDPNDARSVAVAALRSPTVPEVHVADHAAVMKVWAKRHRDLSRQHNRVACRLHSVLCDLVPGGIAGEISPAHATRLLEELEPVGAVATARHELAVDLVADLDRLRVQRRDARRRITAAVTASKTTLTALFGVGPIVAATVIGDVGDIARFPTRDRFAAYNGTAPIEVSSGGRRKVFRLTRCEETGGLTTPSTWPPSPRSASATARDAPTTTARSPKATPARKRSAPSSGASATPSTSASATTPKPRHRPLRWAREGTRGTTLSPA
jgi:transposase